VEGFTRGTQLPWRFVCSGSWWRRVACAASLAVLPLLIGAAGCWADALGGIRYNFANIVALPLVIALPWITAMVQLSLGELKGHSPLQVSLDAGKVIGLAAGTELAGLGAITWPATGACLP